MWKSGNTAGIAARRGAETLRSTESCIGWNGIGTKKVWNLSRFSGMAFPFQFVFSASLRGSTSGISLAREVGFLRLLTQVGFEFEAFGLQIFGLGIDRQVGIDRDVDTGEG